MDYFNKLTMKKRIIVIGGLSAGPSAAVKARRMDEHCEIILFERTGYISYATCGIPYALSGKITDRSKLMVVQAGMLRQRFNIDVRLHEGVIDIDVEGHRVTTNRGAYTYDKLIFTTGATPYTPPIKGLDKAQNWSHCKTIEHFDKLIETQVLQNCQHFTVLGGGLIGIEVTENLVKAGKSVTLIELAPHVLPIWDQKFGFMAEKVLRSNGVDVRTEVAIESVSSDGKRVLLNDQSSFSTDYLLVAVGVKPNTDLLLSEGVEHLKNGALIVNEFMETSLPDIYAAGDCASIKNLITGKPDYFPMGTHSNKGGRAAGANATSGQEVLKGAYGTGIVKVFDYTLARTGMNARSLKNANIPFESTFFISSALPGFFSKPKDLFIELYFHPETRTILGAEIFGEEGVDKRIDVLSTCIYARLKVEDLPNLDLAYAPPYSPAKDPVIMAGYIAANKMKELYQEYDSLQLEKYLQQTPKQSYQLIDVRTAEEVAQHGLIEGAIHYPLDELRKAIPLIDPKKEIFVYCMKGLRGYMASMILVNHGFKRVRNVSGGFLAWKKIVNEQLKGEYLENAL
jgi:NADPH-dependent 2,4-dienoyl-CoA reductase/sulfur reductase-like enzyme/rhodanese-related sulfurtransferase